VRWQLMRRRQASRTIAMHPSENAMYRLPIALTFISLLGHPLAAQAGPGGDSLAFDPVGHYRLEIFSPLPRGQWSSLVVIRSAGGHYEGTFGNPDGPETYPVKSVEPRGDSLFITMAGQASGSVFALAVKGDSIAGTMTSLANGLTQVKGIRLKQ